MDDFFNVAVLMSFAIGFWTIANRRDVLNQESHIAAGIIRGLYQLLLAAPIRPDLALEEFTVAFRRLEESVDPESELAMHLSDIQLQLSLLSVDVEANPDA